ncbi:MAG: aspartate--ammonia ligase [Clostridia bacterium]|nr:aspartate--ammonia ligase [Clostridia bacterium]
MSETYIPPYYTNLLNLYETQDAIEIIKETFAAKLRRNLNLKRVSAPLFVIPTSGLNDDLSGIERPVRFEVPACGNQVVEVVHSLAKWKRLALYRYGFSVGEGLYTDMNAIRRDEALDNLHSIYVDQWDWELIIKPEQRTLEYLREVVVKICDAIFATSVRLRETYPELPSYEHQEVCFLTAQELENAFPDSSPKEREYLWAKEHPVTFLIGIGEALASGHKHDDRAPDYDDWQLNGDLLFFDKRMDRVIEISSMGIRVNPARMRAQLSLAGQEAKADLPFHKLLLEGKLPQTMGGGIGQSRLCLLLMGKAHIGEVQTSIWDPETEQSCARSQVILL